MTFPIKTVARTTAQLLASASSSTLFASVVETAVRVYFQVNNVGERAQKKLLANAKSSVRMHLNQYCDETGVQFVKNPTSKGRPKIDRDPAGTFKNNFRKALHMSK